MFIYTGPGEAVGDDWADERQNTVICIPFRFNSKHIFPLKINGEDKNYIHDFHPAIWKLNFY